MSILSSQEYQAVEKTLRTERDQFRDQFNATKNEVENLRGTVDARTHLVGVGVPPFPSPLL
jgi:hypothetical protein